MLLLTAAFIQNRDGARPVHGHQIARLGAHGEHVEEANRTVVLGFE